MSIETAYPITPETTNESALAVTLGRQHEAATLAVGAAAAKAVDKAPTPSEVRAVAANLAAPTTGASLPTTEGDPQSWLGGQLCRFSAGEPVDAYAELLLRAAGFAPAPR